MPKVAILGASGFLGLPILKAFEMYGWEVVTFTRSNSVGNIYQNIFVDLFNEDSIKSALSKAKPNLVLSTAWETTHGRFWTSPLNLIYRDATLRFAELCFQSGIETFVGLGTMSEYGTSPGYCKANSSPLIVSDLYSKTKIETGTQLEKIGAKYGSRTHWARIFQAFGPNEKPQRFIPGLVTTLRNHEEFRIRTPNFEMDWIHSEDIASALVFMVTNKLNHFVDVGTGVGTSVKELSELICHELKLDSSLLDFSYQIPGHEKKAVVDRRTQLLSLGWKPTESLRNRIRSLR